MLREFFNRSKKGPEAKKAGPESSPELFARNTFNTTSCKALGNTLGKLQSIEDAKITMLPPK